MKALFIEYPKCTTCKRARKFLDENSVEYEDRHIIEANPNKEELKKWINQSGLEIKKFFNTSGVLYKELQLKDKLKGMSNEEAIELLSTNGKLVKRPLLIIDEKIIVGFKEDEYKKYIVL